MENRPAIILHSPQMGENIGATARAMLNFGCKNLRIVSPRDGWPNAKAIEMSAGAKAVIENAQIFPDLASAIADLQTIYATSARPRDMNKPVISPREIELTGKCGIVFGAERTGLENKDISMADKIISISVSNEYQSLNLAQSVGIICYELFSRDVISNAKNEVATKQEFESMFEHLHAELNEKNFFQVPEKKPNMLVNIRNMFLRAEFSGQEIRTMRGIIRCLSGRD